MGNTRFSRKNPVKQTLISSNSIFLNLPTLIFPTKPSLPQLQKPHSISQFHSSLLPPPPLLSITFTSPSPPEPPLPESAMKSTLLPLVIVLMTVPLAHSEQLTFDYYAKTCPKFDTIMKETVTKMQLSNPTTAAAVLRLFFHDCMVDGCDASTLIASTPFHKSERDAELNLDLPGDAFEMMVRAKTALELDCPDVVSCADILSVATRNLVTIVGGPFYPVRLGRKDGLVSDASRVEGNLLRPTMPVSQIIAFFVSRGFTIQEMVTLMGAHTIGFSHCKEFSYRLYNFSKDSATDPSLNPKFADGLKKLCANRIWRKGWGCFPRMKLCTWTRERNLSSSFTQRTNRPSSRRSLKRWRRSATIHEADSASGNRSGDSRNCVSCILQKHCQIL